MDRRYLIIFVIVSFVAVKEANGQTITNNYLFNQSFPGLYKQVTLIMKNIQTLALNSTLANAKNSLVLAKNMIIAMQTKLSKTMGYSSSSNSSSSNGTSTSSSSSGSVSTKFVNATMTKILNIVNKIKNQATGKGVDVSSCTNGTISRIMGVGIDIGARVAGCPVDEATKALKIINYDIAYVSDLINLTMYAPQALNYCLNLSNITSQANCVSTYLQTTATKLITSPATITGMVNDAYAYVSIFPTNVAVCATNTTFTGISNAANLGLSITTCIAAKFLSS